MKIKIRGHEIVDPTITAVSLVKRGAIRSPFKICKAEGGQEPKPGDYVLVLRGGYGHSLDDLEADVLARCSMAAEY
jgi:hypothetical protein